MGLTLKVHGDLGVTLVDELEDGVPWRDVVGTIDTVHGVAGDTHVALKVSE